MKVLVFGTTGQVGRELKARAGARQIAPEIAPEIAPDITVQGLSRAQADFEDPRSCARQVETTDADAVIIAAAWTAVDAAEAAEDCARVINAETPGAIARAAAARALPLVHISTDYVFDGQGAEPFAPGHPTAPLGAYGRTKELGEREVRAAGGAHVILRSSWVFSEHGGNFVKTMLRLGAERERLNIVSDQIGGPTAAADIARACLAIAGQLARDPGKSGTYHFSGAPDVSWAGFAREIFALAGLSCRVDEIPSAAYPTPAPRPLNSRLDNRLTTEVFGLARPDWRRSLKTVIETLKRHGIDERT